jgi:cytochrome b561
MHPDNQTPAADMTPRPRSLVLLHWLTASCLVLGVALVLTREAVDGRAARGWLLEGHRHFGLVVLLLFAARMVVRLRIGRLPHNAATSWLVRQLATLTHVLLYATILVLPLLGWALSSASDKPVHFFGLTLPALVAPDEDLADALAVWHVDAAWVLLGLVCLHAGAALWHHFIRHDGVLRAMWPRRRP